LCSGNSSTAAWRIRRCAGRWVLAGATLPDLNNPVLAGAIGLAAGRRTPRWTSHAQPQHGTRRRGEPSRAHPGADASNPSTVHGAGVRAPRQVNHRPTCASRTPAPACSRGGRYASRGCRSPTPVALGNTSVHRAHRAIAPRTCASPSIEKVQNGRHRAHQGARRGRLDQEIALFIKVNVALGVRHDKELNVLSWRGPRVSPPTASSRVSQAPLTPTRSWPRID
jgi:hypothetical protein